MNDWLPAFAITQLIEVPIYLLALSRWTRRQAVLLAFGASVLTHPVLWLTFPLVDLPYWVALALFEGAVVIIEGVYLRLLGVEKAFAWALLANAASAGFGFLLRWAGVF